MFYLQKIESTTFKKQILIDAVLHSEEIETRKTNKYYKVGNEYISDFSERTLFASLSEVYAAIPKKMEIDKTTMIPNLLPDPDFSSLSKEDGMKEIYDCLNYVDKLVNNDSVEYLIVEE